MRIAIVTPEFMPNWGGIGTYVEQLAENLPNECDVHIITLGRKTHGNAALETDEVPSRIKLHTLGQAGDFFLYNSQFQVALLREFKHLDSKYHFDILHANHAQMPDLFLRLLGHSVPTVTTVHTTIGSQRWGTAGSGLPINRLERSEKMTYLLLPALATAERSYFHRNGATIFVSEFIKEFYQRTYSLPSPQATINNGVNIEKFRPRPKEECLEHFPDLAEKDNIILFSGRLIALKGLNTLIEAFARHCGRTDCTLVLAGPGKVEPWKRMLDNLGVPSSRYHFLGPVPYPKMPFLYPLARTFVLPSFSESFPMTILEAMACGTPIIASEVGGIPEMVRNGLEGELFRPGDALDLSDRLERLRDEKKTILMSRRARERVEDHFTARQMAIRTAEFYSWVMEERN